MIIYKILNKVNGKIYIGLTVKDLSCRIASHIRENKSYIQKALRKYGLESFEISVIDHAESRDILCEKEKYWIRYFNCKSPNGYNLTDSGDGLINPTQKVRDRIRKSVKKLPYNPKFTFTGHSHSEKSKRKTSESIKKTMSLPEIKAKMSKASKGKKKSEEHKRNIGLANKGKLKGRVPWNAGLKMKSLGYVNGMKNKNRPDLSERNRLRAGRKDSKETKSKKSKSRKAYFAKLKNVNQ